MYRTVVIVKEGRLKDTNCHEKPPAGASLRPNSSPRSRICNLGVVVTEYMLHRYPSFSEHV
jgi:hypothetical protein